MLAVLVGIGLTVVVLSWAARRLRVPAPVMLLLGGVPLAFLPWTAHVQFPPEVVLLVFLPALLYWESLSTSLREIRAGLRVIILNAVVLVVVTAAAVAVLAHHVIGLSWPVAWVLGAVTAPTDATALSAVAGRLPRRALTKLRAESLVNDGTALVVFALAVETATGAGRITWSSAAWAFTVSYLGGAAAGLLTAWMSIRVRKALPDRLLKNGVSVLTPFVACLVAEQAGASGVLAVVVCGLVVSRAVPRFVGARTRLQNEGFWELTTFGLNGTLFVLVGLQLRGAVDDLSSESVARAACQALLVAITVIVTRLVWYGLAACTVVWLGARRRQQWRKTVRHRLPDAWAGFRGGVSLAAALAVPLSVPDRDRIVLVTFGVILVTLLLQGLTLPAVLRFARLPDDRGEALELALAEHAAVEAGLAALTPVADHLGVSAGVRERVRLDYEERLRSLTHPGPGADPAAWTEHLEHLDYQRLHAQLLPVKRAAVVRLRDDRSIDDAILRRMHAVLDAEELRFVPGPGTE